MKKILLIAVSLYMLPLFALSQDITGLWKGTMYNDSTKTSLPYELLIKKEKGKLTGYTHSWFIIDGKEYYGIKTVKVSVAKDGKIIIKDASLVENNYPVEPDKDVHQLNVLDLVNQNEEDMLDGLFVTNRTREFRELTGHINVKKVNSFTESSLIQYLQRKGDDKEAVAVR